MTMIPAFDPWTEHPADTDEEKRLASAQQSKTSPLSVDRKSTRLNSSHLYRSRMPSSA